MLTKRHASTSLIALASLFWLAGAKADGCTGSVTPEEPTIPAGSECAPGTHLESFCDPAVLGGGAADPGMPGVAGAPGGNCHDECVPDGGLCPPGFGEQWVCEAWAEGGVPGAPPLPPDCDPNYGACPPPPPPPCDPANGDCPPPPPPPCDPANGDCPPPPACHLECVPLDPCGPGFHAEYQCGGGEPVPMGEPGQPPPPPPAGTAGSDPGQVPPAPPEDCGFVCVPDSICPDGMYETLVCTGVAEPGDPGLPPEPGDPNLPPEPGVCYTQCMPLCPEGTVGETVCTDSPDPGFPGTCFVQCIPIDLCPPGTVEQTVCDPSVPPPPQEGSPDLPPPPPPCWTECVPEPTCPPGEHVEPDCGNIDGGGGATPACVPVCVPDVLCDPTLECGQALACFDGLLYPTICGPQNCDAPLGPCEAPAPLPMRIRR